MECACFLLAPKNASLLFNPVAVHTINTDTPLPFSRFHFLFYRLRRIYSLRSSGLQRSAREMLSGVILRNGRIAVEARNEAVRAQKTGMNAKTMLTLEAKARGAEQVAMRATDMVGVNGDPIRCKADLPAPSSPSRPSSTSSNSDGGRAYVKEKSNKKWLAAHGKGGEEGGQTADCYCRVLGAAKCSTSLYKAYLRNDTDIVHALRTLLGGRMPGPATKFCLVLGEKKCREVMYSARLRCHHDVIHAWNAIDSPNKQAESWTAWANCSTGECPGRAGVPCSGHGACGLDGRCKVPRPTDSGTLEPLLVQGALSDQGDVDGCLAGWYGAGCEHSDAAESTCPGDNGKPCSGHGFCGPGGVCMRAILKRAPPLVRFRVRRGRTRER